LNFFRYMRALNTTFAAHDLQSVGPKITIVAYSISYLLFWPVRRSYNPRTRKRSIKQLVKGHVPRKNPMQK